jgi:probable rRNA maturation factor
MPPKTKTDIDVELRSRRWNPSDAKAVRSAVLATLDEHLPKTDRRINISVSLDNDQNIKELNHQWRDKDTATNVLSFPSGELENIHTWPAKQVLPLGDIILAHETCARESKNFGIEFHHHIMFLAVHGTLHLLGHDHETDADHQKMIKAELKILSQLKLANPYPLMHNHHNNA